MTGVDRDNTAKKSHSPVIAPPSARHQHGFSRGFLETLVNWSRARWSNHRLPEKHGRSRRIEDLLAARRISAYKWNALKAHLPVGHSTKATRVGNHEWRFSPAVVPP